MNNKQANRPLSQQEQMLKAYNAKLKREAVLKSLLLALVVGFALSAIVSIVSFATARNMLWIALVVLGVSTAGLSVLFYYKLYRPSVKTTAERVDEVGLEERVITMVQFEGEDNAMLNRQRQDAHTALSSVSAKQVKVRLSKVVVIVLAVLAIVSIFMMSYSTVLANGINSGVDDNPPEEEEQLSEEDKIIRDMIKALREEIDDAPIDETLRGYLHKLVDDLENSLKPEDTLEVKVAKIMDTADKIHRLIKEYLSRTTIAQELQKHDTTKELGEAIETEDVDVIADAFQAMYDRIAPLVGEEKYDELYQTAMDILQSIEDADIVDEALAEALRKLAQAFLDAIPTPPPEGGEEPKTNDEINQEIKDAIDEALGAIQDALEQQDQSQDDSQQQQNENAEQLDQDLQDIIKDAMEQLGQEFEYPEDDEQQEQPKDPQEEGQLPDDNEDQSGNQTPDTDDGSVRDTVIDGKTPYEEVFDDGYSDELNDKLEDGDLTDEDREIIQDYLDTLN